MVLGLIGAALDFYAGFLLFSQSMSPSNDMAMNDSAALAWGGGITAIGVVLAVTSVASLASGRSRNMKDLGALMLVYGSVMLFIGASMYLGLTSMTAGALLPALGMLVVGALMVLNGAAMRT